MNPKFIGKNTEINLHLYDQLIYDKGIKNKQCGKDRFLSKFGKTQHFHSK